MLYPHSFVLFVNELINFGCGNHFTIYKICTVPPALETHNSKQANNPNPFLISSSGEGM